MQSNDYRFVYFVQSGQLHLIIENILLDKHFQHLTSFQQDHLHYYLIFFCANRYYNQHRIRYFINKAFKYIHIDHYQDKYVDLILQKLISTDLAIGYISKSHYQQLLIQEHRHKTHLKKLQLQSKNICTNIDCC